MAVDPEELQEHADRVAWGTAKAEAYVLVNIALTLMICFGSLEVQQMFAAGL